MIIPFPCVCFVTVDGLESFLVTLSRHVLSNVGVAISFSCLEMLGLLVSGKVGF